jgi:hypothetical protein
MWRDRVGIPLPGMARGEMEGVLGMARGKEDGGSREERREKWRIACQVLMAKGRAIVELAEEMQWWFEEDEEAVARLS